jgi:hypothetical protein
MPTYDGKTCTILYNKKLIEAILIKSNLPHDRIGLDRGEIQVDPMDIIEFVAETYVKPKLIQRIKNTPALDILINQITPKE